MPEVVCYEYRERRDRYECNRPNQTGDPEKAITIRTPNPEREASAEVNIPSGKALRSREVCLINIQPGSTCWPSRRAAKQNGTDDAHIQRSFRRSRIQNTTQGHTR